MKLYEIDAAIQKVLDEIMVDPDTGEAKLDEEALAELQMEREKKLEGVALAIKNLSAEAAAIKAEEDNLAKRRKVLENKVDSMKGFLRTALNGEKLKTARVSVSTSAGRQSCKIDDAWAVGKWFWKLAFDLESGKIDYKDYQRIRDALNVQDQPPKINASGCKGLLQEGYEIPGAHLEEGAPSLRIV